MVGSAYSVYCVSNGCFTIDETAKGATSVYCRADVKLLLCFSIHDCGNVYAVRGGKVKNGVFVLGIIIGIVIISYSPRTKTLTGEVQYVEANEIVIDCPKPKQSRFKPSEDIGYSCVILLDENTVVEPKEKIQQGQIVSVELAHKTKINTGSKPLLAAKIKILTN